MLRVVDLNTPAPEVENVFEFALDPFQKFAIDAINKNENVLVTAKTGSGKTLVGEYQIIHSLKKGKRVFYTTPIKSLSNQKFHDLKKIHKSVGIMTGDIKFCPQADVVIMTTEILRNLLYKKDTLTENIGITANLSLDNLDAVIFDEVHYINDKERGSVWEECLTLLDPSINLVLLSATIDSPEKFGSWLGEIKQKPLHLISTEYRIVPLIHKLANGEVVMDQNERFNGVPILNMYKQYISDREEHRKHREKVRDREENEVIEKTVRLESFIHRMNKLITTIDLPALFFVFSKRLCEEYATKVEHCLLDSSDTASVRHIVEFHLHRYPELQNSSQYHKLFPLLEKGIAYHHSGMLPVLKEIIEILFSRGFIKLLFATETFAVGINMPTKTVVFTGYRKYDDELDHFRLLTTSEYTQMAGRAGRRGKDDKGIVVYLPIDQPEGLNSIQLMMKGKKATVMSQMDFHYEYVLATLLSEKSVKEKSYWFKQRMEELEKVEKEIETRLSGIPKLDESISKECEVREVLEAKLEQANNSEKRKCQSDVERWKNSHFQKKWDDYWKMYKKGIQIIRGMHALYEERDFLKNTDYNINYRKDILEYFGYTKNDKLTQLGILASEIHEGNPLVMSYAFMTDKIKQLNDKETIGFLSCFLEEKEEIEYENDKVVECIDIVKEYAHAIAEKEILKSEPLYWKTTYSWIDISINWYCYSEKPLEIEEGLFVKAMLKLSNIVEEWNNIARIMQDTETLEKLKFYRENLVKSFVVPDSLYLRI